jgi:hypothetical protein
MSHTSVPHMLIALLQADATIAEKIGDRIQYQTIDFKSPRPYLYFTRQNEESEKLLDGSPDITEDSYVFELVDDEYDDALVTAIKSALDLDGFDYGSLTIFCSDVTGVSDDYQFRSADSDALFLNGLVLTIHLCENE